MKQAINTRTQEEYDALRKYATSKEWFKHKENTCVDIHSDPILDGEKKYYKKQGYEIIPYAEFAKANIVEEKKCQLGCKIFTGGEIKHHKDCVYYPESMSQMLDDYKALYLEGRELLEKAKDTIEYLMERGNIASSTSKYDVRKIEAFLTKHNDLTNHKDGE